MSPGHRSPCPCGSLVVVVSESLSHTPRFVAPWTSTHQASLSSVISWSLLKFMSIESVMSFYHLILWCPFLLLPSIFPSIRVAACRAPSIAAALGWALQASVMFYFSFPVNARNKNQTYTNAEAVSFSGDGVAVVPYPHHHPLTWIRNSGFIITFFSSFLLPQLLQHQIGSQVSQL